MPLIPEVVQVLMSIQTTQEVEEAFRLLKMRHTQLRQVKAAQVIASNAINVGMKVSFKARRGNTITGTVTKINRTTAIVQPDGGGFFPSWRVSLGALRPVAEAA